jgi:hypothetical protein
VERAVDDPGARRAECRARLPDAGETRASLAAARRRRHTEILDSEFDIRFKSLSMDEPDGQMTSLPEGGIASAERRPARLARTVSPTTFTPRQNT